MLQELMNSIQKEMTSFHVMERRMTAAEIFGDAETWWLSDYPCLPHPGIIKAMLLRLPITIYVHEQPEGGPRDPGEDHRQAEDVDEEERDRGDPVHPLVAAGAGFHEPDQFRRNPAGCAV